jgi:hypothetical protein
MIAFLDCEASPLSKKSYPIEVAWITEEGHEFSALLRLVRDWTNWSAEAEATHGISRERLRNEGRLVNEVAHLMVRRLSDRDLFASAMLRRQVAERAFEGSRPAAAHASPAAVGRCLS